MNIRKQSSKSIDIDVHSKITAKYKGIHSFFPQQRKLMGSSAQNSSGVHWCRCRVSFNEVPEKVPQVPGAETGQVQQGSGEGSGEGSEEGLGGFDTHR